MVYQLIFKKNKKLSPTSGTSHVYKIHDVYIHFFILQKGDHVYIKRKRRLG